MNISIIGVGSIGKRHLKNCKLLKDELKIGEIRAYDPNGERLEDVKKDYPDIITTTNLNEAINDVEAVFVCNPTSLHIPLIAEISKEKRFHLYLEKPVSHTLEGCDELVFEQRKAGKVLSVGYMLPMHPVLLKVKEMLKAGELGRILSVRAESGFYLPQWHPWEDYRDFYMSWKTGGGGALLDTSHEINYLQWLLGDIVEVKGYMGTVSDLEISSDDLVTALLQFKSGVFGQLHLDLLQFDESRYCKLIGTEAVLIMDLPTNTIKYNKKGQQEWEAIKPKVEFDKIYHEQLREFFAACRGVKATYMSGEEAVKTMQVVEAIRRSNAYSTSVKLPLYN